MKIPKVQSSIINEEIEELSTKQVQVGKHRISKRVVKHLLLEWYSEVREPKVVQMEPREAEILEHEEQFQLEETITQVDMNYKPEIRNECASKDDETLTQVQTAYEHEMRIECTCEYDRQDDEGAIGGVEEDNNDREEGVRDEGLRDDDDGEDFVREEGGVNDDDVREDEVRDFDSGRSDSILLMIMNTVMMTFLFEKFTNDVEYKDEVQHDEVGNVPEEEARPRPAQNDVDGNISPNDDYVLEGLISGREDSDKTFGCRDSYTYFDLERDMFNPTFKVGMRFGSGKEFKEVVRNYCINEGKTCKFRPSEEKRARVVCTIKGCNWVIFASLEATTKNNDLVFKTLILQNNN